MTTRSSALSTLAILGVSLLSAGCASIDRMGAKMDMAVNRMSEQGKHEYEGRLEAIEKIGPMIAIQLSGGKLYDVVEASQGLVRGDIVRIYKTEKGYEARLWKQAQYNPVVSESVQPVQRPANGS